MPGFRKDTPDLTNLILEGYYGFMDYAVALWVRHVEEAALAADEEDAMIKDLAESLTTLLDIHFTAPKKQLPVSHGNKKRLQVFQGLSSRFHDLEQVVVRTRKELTFFGEIKESERALDFDHVINGIRSRLEQVLDAARNGAAGEAEGLEAMYGSKPFKCDRLSCRYFYDGFTTAQEREQHHGKHLLPFRCTVLGCPRSSLGMASSKELDRHVRDTHGRPGEDSSFPDLVETSAQAQDDQDDSESSEEPESRGQEPESGSQEHEQAGGLQTHEATPRVKRPRISEWECVICSKVFRKKFNMESHMVIHSDNRDFSCSVCSLSFARVSDRNRHERTHKAREVVCGGELPDGQRWGCGRKFGRADTLRNHHRTPAGQACYAAAAAAAAAPSAGAET
ncbi:hypothetical protein Daus18300_008914 [Diaporthe australafricana]|uniref:C2H2-type domain-containing protein n=1 Tax=Diaporthe australafricana TaxID=127596 RepID=A0ABR3WGI8_9PEZI